ncbi:CAAD domain-containing protein [Cyanobium sp. CH-040]|uniref:CAAD domain-containing protein n=1 Tax=Cyanobium sp. CH-040 TaxID=2823708 RepID=UPI0020CE59AB|nr:CAAD domain-containing protein [Cyanobium sp. CH-040]MCP9928507.1 CAAD domain-containing protein [Cyanobium sp. CH-040]
MSDILSTTADPGADASVGSEAAGDVAASVEGTAGTSAVEDAAAGFSQRYSEILGQANTLLEQVDWSQMGRIGKAVGILLVVIVAQILIKGVLDTINLLPIVPGLLELLGLVVVGQWSWQNLTTGEKRSAVMTRIQNLRRDYLG